MKEFAAFNLHRGDLPLVTAAIHDGHELSADVREIIALSEAERLREEDPFTRSWTDITHKNIVARYSRFQVDLNRPREKAVYIEPEDAWGLNVWKTKPTPGLLVRSLEMYDSFYDELRTEFTRLKNQHGRFIVYDLHSYNFRRGGPGEPAADPQLNPEVNIGTGTMARGRWTAVVDCFIDRLREFDFMGRHLDVRENVKFKGGYFPRWIHDNFPGSVCCISIEFKKFFMDEWTGKPDPVQLQAIGNALKSTIPVVLEELKQIGTP
jgi:N-formylglutamate amidohydrolase